MAFFDFVNHHVHAKPQCSTSQVLGCFRKQLFYPSRAALLLAGHKVFVLLLHIHPGNPLLQLFIAHRRSLLLGFAWRFGFFLFGLRFFGVRFLIPFPLGRVAQFFRRPADSPLHAKNPMVLQARFHICSSLLAQRIKKKTSHLSARSVNVANYRASIRTGSRMNKPCFSLNSCTFAVT